MDIALFPDGVTGCGTGLPTRSPARGPEADPALRAGYAPRYTFTQTETGLVHCYQLLQNRSGHVAIELMHRTGKGVWCRHHLVVLTAPLDIAAVTESQPISTSMKF